MSKDKFCVHIAGVDDVIPVVDMAEAVKAAAYLNAEYLTVYSVAIVRIITRCMNG